MRRIFIFAYSAFVLLLVINYLFYRGLYTKQINYIFELLDQQVQIAGLEIDETNNSFVGDLNQINSEVDFSQFFTDTDPENQRIAKEKMKVFFLKYDNFITGMKYFDNQRNEFSLKQNTQSDNAGDWLEQPFVLHSQAEIFDKEKLVEQNSKYNYYLPVFDQSTNELKGNIVVTVDFVKYFSEVFATFNLQDYQWQWVVSDSGDIIYDNFGGDDDIPVSYLQVEKITSALAEGSVENITHNALIGGEMTQIISSYYSAQLLHREMVLVFSAPTARFQRYIMRNSLFIVLGTLFLFLLIIIIFRRYILSEKAESEKLKKSERMLFNLIGEMPVGLIIHNKNREIIKANKVAAGYYSYKDEAEMQGKVFPERALPESSSVSSQTVLHPDQFIVVRKESGEVILFRKSIPAGFMEEDATMEILVDVTPLESARKHEAVANTAKSDFLARMSYEIRTPLSGIIGMTDVLNRADLTDEVKEVVHLLRRSTEVLLNIINDILDFSKIEAGEMSLDDVHFNIREEISYCTDLARSGMPKNVITLASSVDENVPARIIGDPFRLRQVLTNLLNHSVKNTENGEIRLECTLRNRKDGIITIGFDLFDTGLNFDKLSLKKIYGDVANIDTIAVSTKDDSVFGTVLARQLVELMGGDFSAESHPGLSGDSGTRVSFSIETYADERAAKRISLEKVTSFDRIHTLVITGKGNRDEEILGTLHQSGVTLTFTTYNSSTINQIRTNLSYPDERYNLIIILDDKVFDGFEAAGTILENKLSGNFIIMMISSNDKKGNYLKSIKLGVDHYLVKPYAASDLTEKLKSSFPHLGETPAVNESVINNLRILVVEDNKLNQKTLGIMLRVLGYSFDIAEDGYTGYLQAKAKQYDLILMDLMLPEIDGFEATQKILKVDKKVKVVAFTSDNMPETRKKAELSGIIDFIPKPVTIDVLQKLFAKHFKK